MKTKKELDVAQRALAWNTANQYQEDIESLFDFLLTTTGKPYDQYTMNECIEEAGGEDGLRDLIEQLPS